MLPLHMARPLRSAANAAASSALSQQQRFAGGRKGGMSASMAGFSETFFKPRGQVSGVGRKDTGDTTTLGCVLNRDLEVVNFTENYRRSMVTLYNKFTAWWSMTDLRRRRDDLHIDGFKHLYTVYKEADACNDMRTLQSVLSVPEYAQKQEAVNRKKGKARGGKRSIEEIKFKPTAELIVNSAAVVKYQSFEFQATDYYQINVHFTGTLETTGYQGSETVDIDEYCVFELAQSNDANTNVLAPVRICGLYDAKGDRIGKDSVDPMFYRAMFEQGGGQ